MQQFGESVLRAGGVAGAHRKLHVELLGEANGFVWRGEHFFFHLIFFLNISLGIVSTTDVSLRQCVLFF